MPLFDETKLTGRDPAYAPGLSWSGPNGDYPRWKAPRRYVKLGCPVTSEKLEGRKGDGLDLDRAARCRTLTREMLAHFTPTAKPGIAPDTWAWLVERYKTDEFSPIWDVQQKTREDYLWMAGRIVDGIGDRPIGWLTYITARQMMKNMREAERSASYIKRTFTQLRMLAAYAVALETPDGAKVREALSLLRVPSPPARQQAITREQVLQIIEQADAAGQHAFALGYLIQFTHTLRAIDVRGDWERSEGEGGITRVVGRGEQHRERWSKGLTWDMVAPDCSSFTKVISKTSKSLPEAMTFACTPEVQRRLIEARDWSGGIGPVIVSERTGLPYCRDGWARAFARFRKAAGIPSSVWMMDARSGAISEASSLGVDPFALRDAAGHKDVQTTGRYARARSANAATVTNLRENQR